MNIKYHRDVKAERSRSEDDYEMLRVYRFTERLIRALYLLKIDIKLYDTEDMNNYHTPLVQYSNQIARRKMLERLRSETNK